MTTSQDDITTMLETADDHQDYNCDKGIRKQ